LFNRYRLRAGPGLWVNSTNGPVAMPNINPQLPEKAMGKPFKVPKSH
jgi:hypothetical protein